MNTLKARLLRLPIGLRIGIAATLALTIMVVAVALNNAASVPERASVAPSEGYEAAKAVSPPPELRCIEKWNSEEQHAGKSLAQNLATDSIYASVGFDVTFPDLCLVTIAVPDRNLASQYRESSGDMGVRSWTPVASGAISDLPASTTNWNARVDSDGSLKSPNSPQESVASTESSGYEDEGQGSPDAGVDLTGGEG